MADSWGGSWGVSWADTWGGAGAAVVTAPTTDKGKDAGHEPWWSNLQPYPRRKKPEPEKDPVIALEKAKDEVEKIVAQLPKDDFEFVNTTVERLDERIEAFTFDVTSAKREAGRKELSRIRKERESLVNQVASFRAEIYDLEAKIAYENHLQRLRK